MLAWQNVTLILYRDMFSKNVSMAKRNTNII